LKYILASASPRRHELLKKIIPDFDIVPANVDENIDESLPPQDYCVILAERKAQALRESADAVVIAADTIVYKDGKYYGKPSDKAEAASHLRTLRDAQHEVYTGVAVGSNGQTFSGYEKTSVIFGAFPDEMLDRYIAEKKPFDKAGSYGVQDIEGYCQVTYLGDYENVMGLPLKLTKELIEEITK
jgi:septum formation protein